MLMEVAIEEKTEKENLLTEVESEIIDEIIDEQRRDQPSFLLAIVPIKEYNIDSIFVHVYK